MSLRLHPSRFCIDCATDSYQGSPATEKGNEWQTSLRHYPVFPPFPLTILRALLPVRPSAAHAQPLQPAECSSPSNYLPKLTLEKSAEEVFGVGTGGTGRWPV